MGTHLNLAQKGLILVGAILAFELFFFCSLFALIDQSQKEAKSAAESKVVAGLVLDIFCFFTEARKDVRGFQEEGLKEQTLDHYQKTVDSLRDTQKKLLAKVNQYPQYKARVEGVIHKTTQIIKFVDIAIKFVREDKMYALAGLAKKYGHFIELEEESLQDFEGVLKEHEKTLVKTSESTRKLRFLMVALLVVGVAVNIIIALALGSLFAKRIVHRVELLIENARRFARGQDLTSYVPEHDEIGHLDRSFREMTITLDEASRRERAIVENASDVICSLNSEFEFVKVSPAAQNVWGIKPVELVNKPLSEIIPRADAEALMNSLRQAKEGITAGSDSEVKIQKNDGETAFMQWSARWSPSESSYFCVAHDITARKLAEAILQTSERKVQMILDNSVAGLLMLEPDGTIDFANVTANAMFGATVPSNVQSDAAAGRIAKLEKSTLTGKSIVEFFPEFGKSKNKNFNEQYFGDKGKSVELEARTSSDQIIPTEASACSVATAQGERLLVNVVDITERREIERMKEEFVAMISHDLRTPLGSVMGFIDLLGDGVYGELTDQGLSRTELAARNIRRLLRLINDLLEITKLESGKLDLDLSNFSSSSIVERSLLSVKELGDKAEVELLSSGSDLQIKADEHRLERVIVNLLSNAIKFSPKGATVTVHVEHYADDQTNFAIFKVIDKGRGIPASHLKTVFDRYKQVKASDASELKGTGLGLAICKGIVEQHGGKIDVESAGIEGEGSAFWFTIPLASGENTDARQ